MDNSVFSEADIRSAKRYTRNKFTIIGWSFFLFLLLSVLIPVLVNRLLTVLISRGIIWAESFRNWTGYALTISYFSMYVISLPIVLVILRSVPTYCSPRKRLSPSQFFGSFSVAYALAIISNLITIGFLWVISLFTPYEVTNIVDTLLNNTSPIFLFLIGVIIGPALEEFVFRKVLLTRLAPFGEKLAIIGSSLFFAFFHQNFSQFLYAFSAGLVFAYVALRSGSIRYTIPMHMLLNFMGIMMPAFLSFFIIKAVYSFLVLGLVIFGSVLFICHLPQLHFYNFDSPLSNKKIFRCFFSNTGVIIFFLTSLFIMMFVLRQGV